MKKFLILFLFLAPRLFAQGNIPQSTYTTLPTGQGVFAFPGVPTGGCSAPQVAINSANGNLYGCTVSGSVGTWTLAGGVSASAGGVGGASSVVLSPNCATPTVSNCFNVKWDTQVVYDATVANTGTTVTCPNNDCNFVAADTGKLCWGVQSSGVYTFGNSLGTFTFVSAQSGTCITGTGAVGAETATLKFAWGDNDTVALTAATAALYALPHCGQLVFPAGRGMLAAGVGMVPTAPAACNVVVGGYYQGAITGFDLAGQSRQVTIIELAPGFDFTKCAATGCFWSFAGGGASAHDFTMDGLNASLSGISTAPATTTLWTLGGPTGGRIHDLFLQPWAYGASNNPGGPTFAGQSIPTENVEVYNFGKNQGVTTCGQNTALIAHYAGGGLIIPANNPCIDFDGAYTTNVTGVDGISSAAGSQFYAYGTYSQETSASSDSIAVTGTVFCNGCNFGLTGTGLSATYQAIKMTGGSIYLQNSYISGGATSGAISGSTGTVFNEGGNATFAGPFAFTGNYVDLTGTFTGAGCTGVVAASQTIGFYGTGTNVTSTLCTNTTVGAGIRINRAAHVYELLVTATAAGVNASSGLVTVLKNGAAQTMVCTIGTGTSCSDGTVAHFVTVAAGDLISLNMTTQAADTLAGVQVSLIIW